MYLRTCLGIYTDKKHYRMTMLRRAFWVGIETGRYQSGFSIQTNFSPLPVLPTNNIEEQRTILYFILFFPVRYFTILLAEEKSTFFWLDGILYQAQVIPITLLKVAPISGRKI